MRYQRLGKAGIKVSTISLGSWRTFGVSVDQGTTEACMKTAYDAGVNYFDGVEIYGEGRAEDAMGAVFRKVKWPRDTLVISSKVFQLHDAPNQRGLSRKHVVEACDAALERMGLEYLDLYFCHRPDPETPLEETVAAMHELILRGKILYWGTSMFSGAEIMQAYSLARANGHTPPTMDQCIYNMFQRDQLEKEIALPIREIGYGTTVFSPMNVGFLSGKYNDGIPANSWAAAMDDDSQQKDFLAEEKISKSRKLGVIAVELGISQARMSLAWCLKNPSVSTVITGSSRAEQVSENVKAAEDVDLLTDEVMARIQGILAE